MQKRQSTLWSLALALIVSAAAPTLTFAAPKDASVPKGAAMKAVALLDSAAQAESVKLDDEQKVKVHAIVEDAMAQAKAIQEENKAKRAADGEGAKDKDARQAAKATVAEFAAQTKARIEAVLTDPQKKAFRAALAEARTQAKEDRAEKKAAKPAK